MHAPSRFVAAKHPMHLRALSLLMVSAAAPRRYAGLVVGLFALGACTSDLPAPDLYQARDDSADTSPGDLTVDCGELPRAAVNASFVFSPQVEGGDGDYRFAAEGLPDGLSIDAGSGQIMGIPSVEGDHTFDLVVTDGDGGMGQDTCSISVHPALSTALELDAVPYCVQRGETLLDFVVDGTGDGTPIVCDHTGGQGNGKTPEGISIDPETCAIEGSIQEVRLGTWAFMVRGTQSGAEVWLPYCVTREDGSGYDVQVEHTTPGADSTLVPLMRRYDASAALDVGGDGDPRFEITHPSACTGTSCFYGYAFSVNSSPFSIDTIAFSPRGLLMDASDEPIGFFHEFSVGGDPVPEGFRARPWTVNFDLDYCLSTDTEGCTCPDPVTPAPTCTTDADCSGVGFACERENEDDAQGECRCSDARVVRANGDGNLEFSIIMVPE
jgi:hypothetical protein